MSDFRAASRYAKSLLELANEQGVLEEVHNDMLLFTKVCNQNKDFGLMLKNPVIKHDKKRAILESIFNGKVHSLTMAIFDIISRKNREAIMPAIAREFHNQYNIIKQIGVASVTTAIPLTDTLRKDMKEIVVKITGKKDIDLKEIVNEEIIGGYILKMGDQQIDDSIRTKLKTLAKGFSQNHYIKEI
ncbi:ATP synthase F1 subunit delta [Fulvivirga sedimenti]|uniref:ATP synthase subunit delta n=1 Tax=Fulvivirga sedimenti TaxID=2879465 RepID=A0A9X1HWF5_9BACT|nr:ATP synthase F1 subunit delta [Fulvivirga sedimenti]MCA6078308.1 ATP synthase F1 subunit delta [Fulvivirga sedimenti]